MVNATAAPTGGRKLIRNLRPGPLASGAPKRLAFNARVPEATSAASTAVATHTASHRPGVACSEAR
jgi:hypothetical protein